MISEHLLNDTVKGIEPVNGLPIDATIWKEAHGYHQTHQRLHAAISHRPGIIFGLEVFPGKAANQVIVAPGIGIDSKGQTLLLTEPETIDLQLKDQNYITISYDVIHDSGHPLDVGGGKKLYRYEEARNVVCLTALPRGPFLELARIDRSTAAAAIKEPANPFDPERDELNYLYRQIAFPHCYADGLVGELTLMPKSGDSWKPNRGGLWNLLRHGNGAGFHLGFSGPYKLRTSGETPDPILLYAAGSDDFQPLSETSSDGKLSEMAGLQRYLERGGTLVLEAVGGNSKFEAAATELAEAKLGAKLKEVKSGHPLLGSHHLFASSPSGAADKGRLLADFEKGVILSTYDYGGAWQGRLTSSDSRERVRTAQEFGINLVMSAATRLRRAAIKALV